MFTLNCAGRLVLIEQPLVMGILNVNEDSFYADSRVQLTDELIKKTARMVNEGVDIIDIGGQSTRPGSTAISEDEELSRVLPAIENIKKEFAGLILSIDTFYAGVARQAVAAGVSIVNDISAGEMDSKMIETVANLAVPYVCMHMKGTPETMQEHATYENVTSEVLDFLIKKVRECRDAGIEDIIIDPGFGFAKNSTHNFTLLKNLSLFNMLELPVMAGISRKATIYKTLDVPVEEALNGTTVMHTLAIQNGASILRAHDVKEAKEVIKLCAAYAEA